MDGFLGDLEQSSWSPSSGAQMAWSLWKLVVLSQPWAGHRKGGGPSSSPFHLPPILASSSGWKTSQQGSQFGEISTYSTVQKSRTHAKIYLKVKMILKLINFNFLLKSEILQYTVCSNKLKKGWRNNKHLVWQPFACCFTEHLQPTNRK